MLCGLKGRAEVEAVGQACSDAQTAVWGSCLPVEKAALTTTAGRPPHASLAHLRPHSPAPMLRLYGDSVVGTR